MNQEGKWVVPGRGESLAWMRGGLTLSFTRWPYPGLLTGQQVSRSQPRGWNLAEFFKALDSWAGFMFSDNPFSLYAFSSHSSFFSFSSPFSRSYKNGKEWRGRNASKGFSIVVQSLSRVWLFVTPWTPARQASLSFTISQSLFKLMSIESMMPYTLMLFISFLFIHIILTTKDQTVGDASNRDKQEINEWTSILPRLLLWWILIC